MSIITIGASAGGIKLLSALLPQLPGSYPSPILITQHVPQDMPDGYVERINKMSHLTVKEAEHLESIRPGHVYFAPAGYHLLVESRDSLALSVDHRVNFARPSIDVLFESAAEIFQSDLLAIVLTGGNHDGAAGSKQVLAYKGTLIVQDPETAEVSTMPEAVLNALGGQTVMCLTADEILNYLIKTRK